MFHHEILALRQKVFDGKFSYFLPPPLIHKIFRYQKFCEIQKGPPTKFFDTVRQQIFNRKSWFSPLRHKIIRYPKLSETPKSSSTKWFGTVKYNNFDGKSWYPPPLYSLNFFDSRNFLKYRRVLLQSFSALWDTKLSMENCDNPLLGIKFFDTRIFLKHRRVPRRNFLALWDENFSTEDRDTLSHKVQKSMVELMFVKTLWKLNSKQ